jgi:uncharacterized damage-inducible protein DinB
MASYPLELLRELYAFTAWADSTVWKSVLACPASSDDGPLRDHLVHIHMVQHAFLSAWKGEPPEFRRSADFPDLPAIHEWARAYHESVRGFIDRLGTGSDEPMIMPWVEQYQKHLGRTFAQSSLGETMFQVVSHSTYHRGQVNVRLRAIGGEPPLVDHIAWIWFGKPEAEW